jgi:hypothetical protein
MLSYEKPKGKPLSEIALRQAIAKALEKGWVRESCHCNDRAYRNISDQDVAYGLEWSGWVFERPPDYDERHESWEYLIRTCDLDDNELHLKISPNGTEGITVITKY